MNQKIKRGRENTLFLFLIFLIAMINIPSVSSACCTNPSNYCQDVNNPQECCGQPSCDPGIYEETPCSETKCEWMGCCLQTCEMTQKKDCNYAFTYINDLEPTYDCTSAPECTTGCCIYLTSENNIGFCEVKPQLDCAGYELYPTTQFHSGVTEEECSNLCSMGQMVAGSISGKIVDNGSNSPIPNAQIIVAGVSIFTNIYGEFFLENSPIGTPLIEISATGYEPISLNNITIVQNETTHINISLALTLFDSGTLTGYVTDSDGAPILAYVYWSEIGSFTTIAGKYTITDILQGDQPITAVADNYQTSTSPVEIQANIVNFHNITLNSMSPEELCGNGQLDFGEQCEEGLDNACPGSCGSTCLCPTSCMDAGGECYTWENQCTVAEGSQINIEGIDLCIASNYDGSSYGCCNTSIIPIPPCINGEQTNEPISATDLTDASGNRCQCGAQYLEVDNLEVSEGYCCDNVYHQSTNPCISFGTFTGYILDSISLQGIESATITLTKIGTTQEYSTSTIFNGNYLIDVQAGSYSLLVTKQGYAYNTANFNILPSEVQHNNISLILLDLECSESSVAQPLLSIDHTRGTNNLKLSWQHPCIDNLDRFDIYRNGQHIHTTTPSEFEYIDSTTEWDTEYEYYVKAYSLYNLEASSNLIILSTGSEECEGKIADESWCIESIKRVVCDEKNKPVLWDGIIRNSPNGDCTVAKGEGSLCQTENDETWCTISGQDCPNTGIGQGNIFGLYYDLQYELNQLGCLEDISQPPQLRQRYCYYDAYQEELWTTVDKCFNCDPYLSCYNYQTEEACILDNCYAGPRNNAECFWYSTPSYFEKLGKGICYQENYQGTDNCNLCSQEGDLFENMACSSDICSKLGNCYSNQDASSCLTCNTLTTCETYNTKKECLGVNEIKFNKGPGTCESSKDFTYSEDNCNLGRCNWISNKCVKDGNSDNVNDCLGSEGCSRDNLAPITSIENKPPFINKEGGALTFSTLDVMDSTYYCLGQNCCPNILIEEGVVLLSEETPGLSNREETIEVNYFSVDSNENIEQIKSAELFIDTVSPDIQITYDIVNSSYSETQSDINILVTVTEPSICQDSLAPIAESRLTNALISDNTSITYLGLEDGDYLYSVTCSDLHQNTITKSWTIETDRIQKIFDESPNLQTLKDSTVTMSLKATDPYFCYYREKGGIVNSGFNTDNNAEGILLGEDIYYYEATIPGLSSNTYVYEVTCKDSGSANANIMDTTTITFTIDKSPPETILLALLQNGTFTEPQPITYSLLTIKLNCVDQAQGPPQESGCDSTKYCTFYEDCDPHTFYNYPTTLSLESGSYSLCYSSMDSFGNQEETKCAQFSVDNTPPSLSITSPVEMGLTSISPYTIEGLWNDTSDIEIYLKAENIYGVLTESVLSTITMEDSIGEFSAVLDLFEGYNKIIATAYDTLGNRFITSINAYLDRMAPFISNVNIYDDYIQNNPDNDNRLEYGNTIIFEANANDNEWSDINNEKTTDISNIAVIISCIPNTGCFNQDVTVELFYDDIIQKYIGEYNPLEREVLKVAEYSSILTAQDQLGNIAYKEDTFSIVNSIEFTPKIHNHLNKRIDNAMNNAEFNYPISFYFDSTKIMLIDSVETIILHETPSLFATSFTLNNQNDFTYTLTSQLPLGLFNVNYTITDIFGGVSYYSQQFNVSDTIPPLFNITIEKNGTEIDEVGYGIYDVIIEGNEPLLSIDSLEYTFSGGTDTIHDISGSGSLWSGHLYIAPIPLYANLNSKTATFEIRAKDLNQLMGTEITSGESFKIHTQGPDPPQIFDPEESPTYTNEPQIFVTGAENDWQPNINILLRKNLASPDPLNPGWNLVSSTVTELSNPVIDTWEPSIYGSIIQEELNKITLNDYSNLFSLGKFIEFSTTKPHNYLYYEIIEIELYSDPDGVDKFYTLTFSPELEENMSSLTQNINIYDSRIPTGWFSHTLNLDPWNNNIATQARDENDNYGAFSDIFTIIYDVQPPEFHQLKPPPDSPVNEERPIIGATIRDTHGGIDESTIILTIENTTLTCSEIFCQSNEDSSEIIVEYTPPPLVFGWYNVSISALDYAGNYNESNWKFLFDETAPTPPNIQLIPGNKMLDGSPYTYYSNDILPSLFIEFSNLEYINLTNLIVERSDNNEIEPSFSQDSHYEFSATFNQQLIDDTYTLKVYASKKFLNDSWSEEVSWQFPFIIDIISPTIEATIPTTTNQPTNIINLSYTETNPYFIEITGDLIPKTINFAELYTPYQTVIELTNETGIKNIEILISDKAGNTATTSLTIELDDIAPTISDDYEYDGIWVATPQTVTIIAEDPNEIKEIRYCLISTCYPLSDGIVLNFPYILTFYEDQSTIVSYQAIDTFDNPSEMGSFNILIDTIPPELTLSTFNTDINLPIFTVTGEYNDVNIENIIFSGDILPITYIPELTLGTYIQQINLALTFNLEDYMFNTIEAALSSAESIGCNGYHLIESETTETADAYLTDYLSNNIDNALDYANSLGCEGFHQTNVLDCGEDIDCFISATEDCYPTNLTYDFTSNLFEWIQTTTTYFEIKGPESENCLLYFQTKNVSGYYSDDAIQSLLDSNMIQEEIDSQEQQINDDLQSSIDHEELCPFNQQDITSIFEDMNEGSLSTTLWDVCEEISETTEMPSFYLPCETDEALISILQQSDINQYAPCETQEILEQAISIELEEGPKTVTATANDKAGNSKTESIIINLDLSIPTLTIDNIENTILITDYYITSSDYLFITGSYLLANNVEIYPENNPSNKAETNDGQFTINITANDGYLGQDNQVTNNTITLIAKEPSGNTVSKTIIVIKDRVSPEITLITPASLSTNSLSPLIELSTSEPAICYLEYWIAGDNYRYIDFYQQDYVLHYVQLTDTFQENTEIPMMASCTDALDQKSELNFSINIDILQPITIYVEVYPAEIQENGTLYASYLLFTTNTVNLGVFATENVKCKYGTIENYEFMEKFPNFDEGEFSGHRLSDTFELEEGDNTLFIGCEDEAGNLGDLFRVDIELNTELPIQLTNIKPTTYTNIQNPIITFDTYRNASCIISPVFENGVPISRVFDSDSFTYVTTNAKASSLFTGSKYEYSAQVSGITENVIQIIPLEDNKEYDFTINCESLESGINPAIPTDLTFITDFTPPFIDIDSPLIGFITNETVLQIQGTTEPLSTFSIYVNNELQSYPVYTEDGIIDTIAILSNGSNEVRIDVIDKATNQNSINIFGIYNNIGPRTELIDPLSGDILNPISSISAKLFPENELVPHPLSTEFVFYTFETTQNQLSSLGTISTTSDTTTLNFVSPWNPLPENRYRTYVVPISSEGVRGEGQNSLFEIRDPIPRIELSSPYTSLPYRHLVVTNPTVDFIGLISTETLLTAELFINGQSITTFYEKAFNTQSTLIEGPNQFAIIAKNQVGDIGIKHGSLILDSQGPGALITIE